MKKQQLLQALDCRYVDDLYGNFDAIPEALCDTEIVIKWMQTSFHHRFRGADFVLGAIPKPLVNDEIRRAAVDLGVHALGLIHPDDTDIYLELVLKATKASNFAYKLIHERFKTRETLEAIVDHDTEHMALTEQWQAWIGPLLTQDMIDRVGESNYLFAKSVGLHNLSWPSLKKLLVNSTKYYENLVVLEGDGLLVKMIQDGGWPDKISGLKSHKPKGLFELAELITKYKAEGDRSPWGSDEYRLYCAYLKTFPTNLVVKVMNTPTRREILLGIYPSDQLLPYVKSNRALRVPLLEDSLGL
jgi:hypothetical protein